MKLLKKLIQIPSFSEKEGKIKEFLIKFCQENSLPVSVAGENLLIKLSSKKKKLLIFNAHLDTVLAGDLSKWKNPPFGPNSGRVVNGKIYGLGASDEKASIASLLVLAKELKNKKLSTDVWLTFVVKEETDGSGTQSFLQAFAKEIDEYKDKAVIICEPTGLEEIQIGHKGNIFLKVITFGDSGHGSEPEKIKNSAIDKMWEVKQKLKTLEKNWQEKYGHKILGKPTIGLTSISAGDLKTPNKFPDSCSVSFDIRTTPGLHKRTLGLIKGQLRKKAKVNYLYKPCPFGLTSKNQKIVKVAKNVLPKTKIVASKVACDLCFFTQVGIPGIILGPGEIEAAHKPNEFCYLSKIEKAAQAYQKIIDLW